MLSCEEALEQMSQALDGLLTEAEREALEAHLAGCPACRADWAALVELHQAMGELEETPAPEGFADRVMERIREEARPARVIPLWRRPQWKAAAGLAACAAICVGLYYGAGLSASGNVAAAPDLAQWSQSTAGSGEASGAAAAAGGAEEPVQGKSAEPQEAEGGAGTADAPRSGAAGGEGPSKVTAVPRAALAQGENPEGTAAEPALADEEAEEPALYCVQEETELLLAALPAAAAELLPAAEQWELDSQGRSFCTVSAQTLEALCGALEAADVPFQRPEQPWSETCRVILAE